MKSTIKGIYNSSQWQRHVMIRATLAVGSLACLVMSSGASSHWW